MWLQLRMLNKEKNKEKNKNKEKVTKRIESCELGSDKRYQTTSNFKRFACTCKPLPYNPK
jgi:hypothetical protein